MCIVRRRANDKTGRLEVAARAGVPVAARKIAAAFCPALHVTEAEYIAMGGEDTSVYIYDISRPRRGAVIVNKLQASCPSQTLPHEAAPYSLQG